MRAAPTDLESLSAQEVLAHVVDEHHPRLYDAWITGLRRDQSPNRAGTPKLGPDTGHPGKLKCAPLADWSEKDVWRYIVEHDVPYHPLHDRGYASIGCTHCTSPGGGRDGRWAGTDKIECGLHLPGS